MTPFVFWDDVRRICLKLAADQLDVRSAAEAAVELADVVERAREKHVEASCAGGERCVRASVAALLLISATLP